MGKFLSYELLPIILNMTLTASVVIVFVPLYRLALQKAPRVFSYALWLAVDWGRMGFISVNQAFRPPLKLRKLPETCCFGELLL